MATQLALRDEGGDIAPQRPLTPMDMVQALIGQADKAGAVEAIERLTRLQMEFSDREDKIAFANAMARFKDQVPTIIRTRDIGGKYKAVALEDVADPLIKALLRVGITYRYKCADLPDGRIRVTCLLRLQGTAYEEEGASLAAPPDTSGGKDALKAVGSTTSYLEKYTLLASCGVHVYGSDPEAVQTKTKPEDLMDEGAVMDYASTIEEAGTVKELETAYFKARDAAKTDQKASKYFAELKNNRYRQLTGGKR